MRHINALTRPPCPASTDIDLNGAFDSKVEAKEIAIAEKAAALN